MRATFGCLSVAPWILFAQMSWDMRGGPVVIPGQPEVYVTGAVHDHGGLFSGDARRRAHEVLRRIQRDRRVPVVIETFESLRGRAIDDVARFRPQTLSADGIYILIAGQECDVAVRIFRDRPDGRPSDLDRAAIREAFLGPLRAGDADEALEKGVRAIDMTVASQPGSGRGSVISVTTLLGILVILLVIRHWERYRGRWERRRRDDAGTVATGYVDRSDSARATAVHVPHVGPAGLHLHATPRSLRSPDEHPPGNPVDRRPLGCGS